MPAFSPTTWRMNSNSASPSTGPYEPVSVKAISGIGRDGQRSRSRDFPADEPVDVEQHKHASRHRSQACDELRARLLAELRRRFHVAGRHVDDVGHAVDDEAKVAAALRRLNRQDND